MSMLNLETEARRGVAATLAVAVVGATAAGGLAACGDSSSKQATAASPQSAAASTTKHSTVPTSLKRAETAAEDVITYLEHGKTPKSPPASQLSRAEATTLRRLAHGQAAAELKRAGVTQGQIREFRQRADRVDQLSRGGSSKLQVSLAANHVSQLMPGFYARYQDPVPPAVLRLDYLDRQIELRSMAGQTGQVRRLVTAEGSTWAKLRPQLVAAGGNDVARQYDAHLQALKQDKSPTAVQKQALSGLDIVDLMETAFLGK